MKKHVFIILLALVIGGYAAATPSVPGLSGDFALRGDVASEMEIVVTNEPGNQSLDLTTDHTSLLVGLASIRTNLKSWFIKVYSVNGSKIMGTTDWVPYTFSMAKLKELHYVALPGSAESAIQQDMHKKTGDQGVNDDEEWDDNEWSRYKLRITYTGNPFLTSGEYYDRIVISVGPN